MKLKTIRVDQVNPAPYNPRVNLKPGDTAYDHLQQSIQEFGCVQPPVWNRRTGNLVGGHQRVKVLLQKNPREIDVVVVDLPLEKEKALNLALNKIQGDWDQEKLALLLDELSKVPDFDLSLTGFELEEAQDLIASALVDAGDREETFDLANALDPSKPPITQPGEIITLGRHRILCGSSVDPSSLQRLLEGTKAHLLNTDPPYNVAYDGASRPLPPAARRKSKTAWKPITADNQNQGDYERMLQQVFTNIKAVLAPGACVYIWNGHRQFGPMHQMLTKQGVKVSCVITWAKESFSLDYGDYHQQTEFCLYGWLEGKGGHKWYGPKNESTLWQIHREPTKSYLHPTQKPLELFERAIRNSTRAGQSVLDPFLGSGTTLISCERTGRRCFGVEIDPHYCDVIVRRYIAFVGERNVPAELIKRYRKAKEAA